ncbi:hypothetical protein L9F63_013428, partial [Diploptera punctata]
MDRERTNNYSKKLQSWRTFSTSYISVHVEMEGRAGKHAGQKRTYRTITETYAFLPREAVTRFLLGCTDCQRRPRSPSPITAATNALKPTAPELELPPDSDNFSLPSPITVKSSPNTTNSRRLNHHHNHHANNNHHQRGTSTPMTLKHRLQPAHHYNLLEAHEKSRLHRRGCSQNRRRAPLLAEGKDEKHTFILIHYVMGIPVPDKSVQAVFPLYYYSLRNSLLPNTMYPHLLLQEEETTLSSTHPKAHPSKTLSGKHFAGKVEIINPLEKNKYAIPKSLSCEAILLNTKSSTNQLSCFTSNFNESIHS